ncbi:MAG TPA: rRNA maturation RNase YbeY [Spirochaetota bacterium]|nr:rRNA maturation RNase YbeY [Spirochaetota bacterium]
MEINIFTEGNLSLPYMNIDEEFCRQVVSKVLSAMDTTEVEVNCIFTDNSTIRNINRDYRNLDHPTDVISFAYRDNPFPSIEMEQEPLGDMYISLEKAVEQATEFKVTLNDELCRLIVHGLLHLLGYEHEDVADEEARQMREAEDRLLDMLEA